MIVGIGGGDQHLGETRRIDRFCLESTGKAKARVLFLPTGARDSPHYAETAEHAFLAAGAFEVRALFLMRNPSMAAVSEAVGWADLVHFGGGSAPLIIKHGDRFQLAAKLAEAEARGAVLAGISGGAIALFQGGLGAYNGYRPLPGWGLAPGNLLPHYRPGEEANLVSWFASHPDGVLWGLEDGTALAWEAGGAQAVCDGPGGVWQLSPAGAQRLRTS